MSILSEVDLGQRLSGEEYQERLADAQLRLLYLQRQIHQQKRRAILLFEGWDAAGKGGAIRRITERLDPRGFNVHPIGAPDAHELTRSYLYRFWTRLPESGQIAIFDRSWYGRVLVERVEELASKKEWKRAYEEINGFERLLVNEGVPIVKFFLHISHDEQRKRFEDRQKDPFKHWKITEEDWRNRNRWDEYEAATEDMLEKTDTKEAPWHVIAAEQKRFARVQVAEVALKELSKRLELPVDPLPEGWNNGKK